METPQPILLYWDWLQAPSKFAFQQNPRKEQIVSFYRFLPLLCVKVMMSWFVCFDWFSFGTIFKTCPSKLPLCTKVSWCLKFLIWKFENFAMKTIYPFKPENCKRDWINHVWRLYVFYGPWNIQCTLLSNAIFRLGRASNTKKTLLKTPPWPHILVNPLILKN